MGPAAAIDLGLRGRGWHSFPPIGKGRMLFGQMPRDAVARVVPNPAASRPLHGAGWQWLRRRLPRRSDGPPYLMAD
jgi:hypothetical protein